MIATLLQWRSSAPAMLFAVLFAAVFLSYSNAYYLAVYPGFVLLQSIGALLFLAWLRSWGGRQERLPLLLLPLLLWFMWGLATAMWAHAGWVVAEGIVRHATLLFLAIGLAWALRRSASLHRHFWLAAVLSATVLALAYARTIASRAFGQFGFPFANANVGGTILGFFAVIAASVALCRLRRRDYQGIALYGASSLCLAGVVVLCGAKSALLSMALALFMALVVVYPRQWWLWAGMAAGAGALVYANWPQIYQRLWPSLEVRLYVWEASWRMIDADWSRLLFGWGAGNFFAVFPDFLDPRFFTAHYQAPVVDFPHNFFLETWCEHGLVGLALLLAMLVLLLRSAWRQAGDPERRENCIGVGAALIMLVLDALTSITLSYPQGQLLLAMALAYLASDKTKAGTGCTPDAAAPRLLAWMWLICTPVFLLCWKYYTWDSLMFQRDYKTALRTPDAIRKLERMVAIELPLLENYHTIHWRNDLGAILLDHYEQDPTWAAETAAPFWEIENKMPKFGFFLLYRAVWEAKRGNRQGAGGYFAMAAAKNPFSLDLWVWWNKACELGGADWQQMSMCNLRLQEMYGDDGALLLGKALALERAGDRGKARQVMLAIDKWLQDRYRDQRTSDLGLLVKEYLRRNP